MVSFKCNIASKDLSNFVIGKHDVGHLHHETPKGRRTMSAASGSYGQTHRAPSRTSQRPSEPTQQT